MGLGIMKASKSVSRFRRKQAKEDEQAQSEFQAKIARGQEGKAEREANWDANAVETGRLNRAAQKERDDRNLQHYAKGTQYRRRRLVERHEINAAMQQIYENKGSVTPAELIDTLESQGKGTLGIMKASKSVSRFRRKQAKEDEQAQSEFQAKIARGQEGKAE